MIAFGSKFSAMIASDCLITSGSPSITSLGTFGLASSIGSGSSAAIGAAAAGAARAVRPIMATATPGTVNVAYASLRTFLWVVFGPAHRNETCLIIKLQS